MKDKFCSNSKCPLKVNCTRYINNQNLGCFTFCYDYDFENNDCPEFDIFMKHSNELNPIQSEEK